MGHLLHGLAGLFFIFVGAMLMLVNQETIFLRIEDGAIVAHLRWHTFGYGHLPGEEHEQAPILYEETKDFSALSLIASRLVGMSVIGGGLVCIILAAPALSAKIPAAGDLLKLSLWLPVAIVCFHASFRFWQKRHWTAEVYSLLKRRFAGISREAAIETFETAMTEGPKAALRDQLIAAAFTLLPIRVTGALVPAFWFLAGLGPLIAIILLA
jgi:hypothetical protein